MNAEKRYSTQINESDGEGKYKSSIYRVETWAKVGWQEGLLLCLRLHHCTYVWTKDGCRNGETEDTREMAKKTGTRKEKNWLNKSRCGNKGVEKVNCSGKFWKNKKNNPQICFLILNTYSMK